MKPQVFAALELADALERSKKEKKLLLVDAAAEWCQPCKIMDQTTWSDQKVVDALAPIAIALQIEGVQRGLEVHLLDRATEGPKPRLAGALGAVYHTKSVREACAEAEPDIVLEWLAGLARGENAIQSFRREVAAKPDDVELRMRFASRLREGGENEEATTQYLWLWNHMLEKDPNLAGVRHSFLACALEGLFS